MQHSPAQATATPDPIVRDGDVVAMIGDSITSDGRWWALLAEQVLVRQPGWRGEFRNCGISGGSADGAVRRYDWDIAPWRPTLALVMFGMNDVNRGAYAPNPTAEMVAARASALTHYLAAMTTLVERLLHDGVRVVLLLTPSPFDQYTTGRAAPNLPGVDDALAICGGMVRGLGAALHLPVVDLHTPLRQRCVADPTLIGDDRVHPTDAGHAAMAEVAITALLPGPVVAVPPALRAVLRTVLDAERRLRTIAMFRSWAQGSGLGSDDAAALAHIARTQATEANPWVRDQMKLFHELLPRQTELATEVAGLRLRLAAAAKALQAVP